MANLSAKEDAFISMMVESPELAQRGFDMLLKRAAFERFFDPLREKGLFAPERNPSLEPAEEEGYFRIPYWNVLDYLVAVSRHAGEQKDDALARKVMEIVRSVTLYPDGEQGRRDNYHTARKFAEVLGLLPLDVITEADLDQLVPIWLGSRFDRGRMVGHALDEGIATRAFASDSAADWAKAVVILRHCTAVRWEKDESLGERLTPRMAVEDYALQELMRHHVASFGRRTGAQAAAVLLARVREVFSADYERNRSRVFRPAVEEHAQNHDWRTAENISVSGLRDVLLHWCDVDVDAARTFIAPLLTDQAEIVRRIGLYLLDSRWDNLGGLPPPIITSQLFVWAHLHELYNLLRNHFAQFGPSEQEATVEAIKLIPATGAAEDDVRLIKREQRHWLSAVAGKGCAAADTWFRELEADPNLGRLPEHPDFDVYLESWSGPGPSVGAHVKPRKSGQPSMGASRRSHRLGFGAFGSFGSCLRFCACSASRLR